MSYDQFYITKRDGKTERFSLEKIKSAILKAFASVNTPVCADDVQRVLDHLKFCNGMSVEDKWKWLSWPKSISRQPSRSCYTGNAISKTAKCAINLNS